MLLPTRRAQSPYSMALTSSKCNSKVAIWADSSTFIVSFGTRLRRALSGGQLGEEFVHCPRKQALRLRGSTTVSTPPSTRSHKCEDSTVSSAPLPDTLARTERGIQRRRSASTMSRTAASDGPGFCCPSTSTSPIDWFASICGQSTQARLPSFSTQ